MVATATAPMDSEPVADTNVETAKGAIILHDISIRLMAVFRCVKSYGVGDLAPVQGFARVGTQSRSIERILVPRESFSTIPMARAMVKRICFPVGLTKDRMKNHIVHETRTLIRLMLIVQRRTRRRDELWSTQRPRALEKKRTQTVSAIPLCSK